MSATPPKPTIDLSFAHNWEAEVLAARPMILPPRHYVLSARSRGGGARGAGGAGAARRVRVRRRSWRPARWGFAIAVAPTGIWSAPKAEEICAVSGGYAYLIDTSAPERFTMIAYRPVLEVRAAVAEGLLLFVGHRSILAWGREGQAWESEKLSDEGVTITAIEGGVLRGVGWEMLSDQEKAFALDLRSGRNLG